MSLQEVLIIDDDEDSIALYRHLLEKTGFSTRSVTSGEKGIEAIKEKLPDAILLDYLMPKMDGLSTMERIFKESPEGNTPPVILLTAHGTTPLAVEFLKAGGIDFLEKPIREAEILALKIRLSIERKRRMDSESKNRLDFYRESILYTVGHEFRTPLTSVKSAGEILKKYYDSLSPEERLKMIEKVEKGADQIETIVDTITELIDIYRSMDGTSAMKVDTYETILEAIQEKNLPIQIRKKGLFFENLLTGDLPPIFGTRLFLKEIMQRLLDNAIKFTSIGGAVLDAEWDDSFVKLYVIDTGVGIREEDRFRIFELFEKLDLSGNTPGIGLGLSVVKKLVQRLNGTIEAHPNRDSGGGTIFLITLPRWTEGKKQYDKTFSFTELKADRLADHCEL